MCQTGWRSGWWGRKPDGRAGDYFSGGMRLPVAAAVKRYANTEGYRSDFDDR